MAEVNKNLNGSDGGQDFLAETQGAESEKKTRIGWWEFYLMAPVFIIPDILDLFSLTGIGTILSWIADLIYLAASNIWLYWKGKKLMWNLITSGLEFIPGVDAIPFRTAAFCILIFLERAPDKVKQTAKVAAEVAIATQTGGAGKIAQKVVASKVSGALNKGDSSSE